MTFREVGQNLMAVLEILYRNAKGLEGCYRILRTTDRQLGTGTMLTYFFSKEMFML